MTAPNFAKLSPREKRALSYEDRCAQIAAKHEEARRIGCPHGNQFYKCDCGEEWAEHNSYPIPSCCDGCGEMVEAQDNPLRQAWLAGFERAKEMYGAE